MIFVATNFSGILPQEDLPEGDWSSCAEKVPWNVLIELTSGPQRQTTGILNLYFESKELIIHAHAKKEWLDTYCQSYLHIQPIFWNCKILNLFS